LLLGPFGISLNRRLNSESEFSSKGEGDTARVSD
jgi:hypothetical protein